MLLLCTEVFFYTFSGEGIFSYTVLSMIIYSLFVLKF